MTILDIIDLLEVRAATSPEKVALLWAPFDEEHKSWTYRTLLDDLRHVAPGLSARGVAVGDRVILHAENSPEFLLTWLGCAWIGAVCVVTNPKSAGPEVAYFASHTGATVGVTHGSLLSVVSEHCPKLEWIISDRSQDVRSAFAVDVTGGEAAAGAVSRPVISPRAAGTMMFTSGTTSRPKAVVWSRGNALWAAQSGVRNAGLTADDTVMVFVPLYHVVGLAWSALPALAAGATILLQPRFSASRFWPVAQEHEATFASHVQFSSGVLSRMPVPAHHHFRLWGNSTWLPSYEDHFRVPIMGWWGMTEIIAPGLIGNTGCAQQPGTIGRAAPGYDVRIVDSQDQTVPPGVAGELLLRGVRGESIFLEYFGDPKATAEAFTEDGWFRTGDRMRMYEDGSIQFVERSRDVIKTGGEGVSPAEVERVIRAVVGVADVALVGCPDPSYGEVGVAFVVPEPGASMAGELEKEIMSSCREQLASFKVPRRIHLLPELPRAGLNKIAKGELRRLAISITELGPNSHE